MDIGHFSLTIHKKIHERTVEREISYRDVRDVVFQEGVEQEYGFLGIRAREDPLPPVTSEMDAVCDETALVFDAHRKAVFCDVYAFIHRISCVFGARKLSKRPKSKICCPQCGSSRYTVLRRARTIWVPRRTRSVWIALGYLIMIIIEQISKSDRTYVCLECGRNWKWEQGSYRAYQVADEPCFFEVDASEQLLDFGCWMEYNGAKERDGSCFVRIVGRMPGDPNFALIVVRGCRS